MLNFVAVLLNSYCSIATKPKLMSNVAEQGKPFQYVDL